MPTMRRDIRAVERYLECIYKIQEEGARAKTKEIARRLGVKQPSVTEMLAKLSEEGLVTYKPYRDAVLTERGARIGRAATRKHRVLEAFLHRTLGVKKGRVHAEACKLEHALSDDVEVRIVKLLGKPRTCPDDGKAIPYPDSEPEIWR